MTETSATPFQITPLSFGLAPQKLWQAINPWNFNWTGDQIGLINISLGRTDYPEVERAVLDTVGSYGKQLGHIGEALAVLIEHFDRSSLSGDEKKAFDRFMGDLAAIDAVKKAEKAKLP